MAVQFSLSYDANGDPVLVENTVTGTRKVVSTSPVVSEYKSRFESPASGDPVTDAEESQPDNNQSAIMDYIMEMEKGADADPNLSFIQKQNLEGYTPEAIEARKKEKTPSQKIVETVLKALVPYGNAASAAIKALSAILPEESEEIKAIKQFYADPEQAALVESIPGMSNYNLVYGNPFDPSYGLADAAAKRTATMAKTLERKYGMTAAEIEMAKAGTYTGSVDSDIIQRIKKTTDLEKKERGEITRIKEQRARDLGDMRGGVGRDSDPAPSAPSQPDYSNVTTASAPPGGGGGQDSGSQSSSSSSSSSGESQYGGFCFDPNTLIQMVNGSQKKIKEIQLGDQTKGGEVTGVFQFKASDEIHDYKGVTVAGSHYVKEDGRFIMVQDSPISVKIDKIPVVYSLDTTGRRIFIKDIEFADYNGDGIAKGFLTNAGVDISGFDREVLRQVENRLI